MMWQIFGQVQSPYTAYGGIRSPLGIVAFLNNILRLLFVVAGIYVLFNLVFAGFQFLNAGGDPKNIETAWNKIWQSLIGMLIIVSSFVIAGLVGLIFFNDAGFLLNPKIYGP